MRLPLLTSRKMISVVGSWVPDLPGCCPTKWQVPSSQARTPVKFVLSLYGQLSAIRELKKWTLSLRKRPPGDCPP